MSIIELLAELDILYKRKENINKLLNLLTEQTVENPNLLIPPTEQNVTSPKLTDKPGNYELAPGIQWVNNICFFSALLHIIYRIEELIPFIIHKNIKAQYNEKSYITDFIELMKIMHNKANTIKNNKVEINEHRGRTENCITGTNNNFGLYEDPSKVGVPLLNILVDICNLDVFKEPPFYPYNGTYEKICGQKKYDLPLDDPRTFFSFKQTIYKCNLNIILNKKDFDMSYEERKKMPNMTHQRLEQIKKDFMHSENLFKIYLQKNKLTIEEKINECDKSNRFELDSQSYFPILSIPVPEINDKNNLFNIEDLIKAKSETETKFHETNYEINYALFAEKTIYEPNKYILIDIPNKTGEGHNIKIQNEKGNIHLKYGNIDKNYELIGTLRYTPGHWTTYIKHNTGWYLYDGGERKKMKFNNIPTGEQSTLFTLLYRENVPNLFDTIDPEKVPPNLNDYLGIK